MMKQLLILGAGEMQIPIIQKAKQMGVYSIVADFDKDAPGLLFADEKAIVSTIDLLKVLDVAKEKKVDGILTTSDFPVNVVANVSAQLNLNSMSVDVANLCTNKYLQREFFKENGIKVPFFKLISNPDELKDISNFPVIIKPIDSSASRGVKKVHNTADLKTYYEKALSYSKQSKVIVEDFITGREFSVETFTQNHKTTIIAITEKLTKGEDKGFFVEDTHIIPARLNDIETKLIQDQVLLAIKAMNINNCPTHTEVKLNENGATIIEMACRLGGDYITSDLVPLATGVDMLENLISISLGLSIDVLPKFNKVAAIQFLNSANYNTCVEFVNSKNDFIIRHEVKPFHNLEITNSMERMGYIILQTNTSAEMSSLLQNLN
jgi:biotin carboxylase